VKVGSEESKLFLSNKGLPQGAPLSCLLWNIYVEPLLRRLKASGLGIAVNARTDAEGLAASQQQRADETCCNTNEAYADDIVAPTFAKDKITLRKNCAAILGYLEDFSTDFRVPLNAKPGKTEIMAFAPYLDKQETLNLRSAGTDENPSAFLQPIPLRNGTDRVRFVTTYKYLGAPLTQNLDLSKFAARKATLLKCAFRFWFKGHAAVSEYSVKAKLQLASTMCINVVLYLISVVPMDKDLLEDLNQTITDIGKAIYGYPRSGLLKTLMQELPFYPAEALVGMQSYRNLQATLFHREQQAPAARILRFQSLYANYPGSFLYDATKSIDDKIKGSGLESQIWQASTTSEIAQASRRIKFEVQRKTVSTRTPTVAAFESAHRPDIIIAKARKNARCPPQFPNDAHVDGINIATLPVGYLAADTRFFSATTPCIALTGPGGLNLYQLVTNEQLRSGILESRNGYAGLGQFPWKRRFLVDPSPRIPGSPRWQYGVRQCCPICGAEDDGIDHVFLRCKGAKLKEQRIIMKQEFHRMLPIFAEALVEATYKTGQAGHDRLNLLESALARLKRECKEQRVEDWIIYRMLLVMPFPSFIADGPCNLGVIFDHCRISRRHGAKSANFLTRWAEKWIWRMSETRLGSLPAGYYS
jgi:Reverse transcriptase (RNA-dependent DNA polymerase)